MTAQALERRGAAALEARARFLSRSLPSRDGAVAPDQHPGSGRAAGAAGLAMQRRRLCSPAGQRWAPPDMAGLADLVDDIAAARHGVIMTMGKGGVGKTTVAAAIAVSWRGAAIAVHLSTTDPAAHVAETLAGQVRGSARSAGLIPRRRRRRISEQVMRRTGREMDASGRALAGRGPALALHGGDRGVPCLRPRGGPGQGAVSWCSTRRRPGTRCCCWMRARRITASCSGRPEHAARGGAAAAAAAARSRLHARCCW